MSMTNNNPVRPPFRLGPPQEQLKGFFAWKASMDFWVLLTCQTAAEEEPWVTETAATWALLAENDPANA